MTAQANDQNQSHPIKYLLVASGGGIVGHDYAKWMEVSPAVGSVIGSVVSLIILGVMTNLIAERESIKDVLGKLGAFLGFLIGSVSTHHQSEEGFAWIVGGVITAMIGYGLGRMVAALIVISAFAVLLLSQGPIGFAARNIVMGLN